MTSFLDLHVPGDPLLAPNPWDVGSARVLAALGFAALATTSSGFAATLGRPDGGAGRQATLAQARELAAATGLPVTADLEDGYAKDVGGVAETFMLATEHRLAGASIEDWDGSAFRDRGIAARRVARAVQAAGTGLVVTARADNHFHGVDDLDDTIARLQAYEAAGAHVLYAPGLTELADVARVVESVGVPVNVLMRPGGPTVPQLADAGVARITVGGAFAFAALGALVEAATELRDAGTTGFARLSAIGQEAAVAAFRARDADDDDA